MSSFFIASDHGGFQLKKRIVRYIENELNNKIVDLGPSEYNETDDYPDLVPSLAKKVLEKQGRGILICTGGIGMCIAANKIHGIRAGLGYNSTVAESMMKDNNTNVLCLAAKGVSEDLALVIVKKWLNSEFSNEERHERRLEKIKKIEENN
jgi:ribose 5-phosphate isomerase B